MTLCEIDGYAAPQGGEAGFMETADGQKVRYALWYPRGQAKGSVCLLQGRAEFIEKYYEVIGELLGRGFAVAALDWRGQGGSTRLTKNPRKGHIAKFAIYDRDLVQFVQEILLPECPPPFFGLAHSMGGNILLRAVAERTWFERVVCVAPMIAIRRRWLPWPGVRVMARMARLVGAGKLMVPGGRSAPLEAQGFTGNPLTADERRFKRTLALVEAHEHLATGSPTLGWLAAALDAVAELDSAEFHHEIRIPVLIVQAGYDLVVSNEAISEFAARLPAGAEIFLEKARHEILFERDIIREQFWAAFDAFIPGTQVQHPARKTSNAFW